MIEQSARRGEYYLGVFTVRYAPLRESAQVTEGMWTLYAVSTSKGKVVSRQITLPSETDAWTGALRELSAKEMVDLREEHRRRLRQPKFPEQIK